MLTDKCLNKTIDACVGCIVSACMYLVGIRNNKYSSAVGNVVYYINRLKLLGNNSSMVDDELSFSGGKIINVTEESMLGKVFGYFFGDANEEEM